MVSLLVHTPLAATSQSQELREKAAAQRIEPADTISHMGESATARDFLAAAIPRLLLAVAVTPLIKQINLWIRGRCDIRTVRASPHAVDRTRNVGESPGRGITRARRSEPSCP